MDEAIEHIGVGRHQFLVIFAGCSTHAFNASISLTVAVAARAIAAEAGLSALYAGMLASCLFGGYIVGNLLGGILADWLGRRMPLLLAFAGYTALQASVALTPGHLMVLLVATLLAALGLFMGIGLAAASAGMKEWTPVRWRSMAFGMIFVFLAFGQLFSAVLLLAMSPDLNPRTVPWKLMFGIGAVFSGLMFVITMLTLPESAHWLRKQGRDQEATDQLRAAALRNGVDLEALENWIARSPWTQRSIDGQDSHRLTRNNDESAPLVEESGATEGGRSTLIKKRRWATIFSGRYARITFIMCWNNFTTNATYYGLVFALPQTLAHFHEGNLGAASMLLVAAFIELPGTALQIYCGNCFDRQGNSAVMFGTAFFFLILLAIGLMTKPWIMIVGVLGSKCFIVASFIITYLLMAEAYPVSCRGFGNGFCMTVGRLGAVVSPIAFESTRSAWGNEVPFYGGLAVLVVIASILSLFLPLPESVK